MCSRAGNWWEHFQSDCLWYLPGRTALFCAVEVKKKCRFLARISPISLGLIRAMTVGSIFDVISRGNCVKNMRRGFQKHVEKFCGVSTDPRNFHSKYNGRLKTAVMYRNCTEIVQKLPPFTSQSCGIPIWFPWSETQFIGSRFPHQCVIRGRKLDNKSCPNQRVILGKMEKCVGRPKKFLSKVWGSYGILLCYKKTTLV